MEYCRIHRDSDTIVVFIVNQNCSANIGDNLNVRLEKQGDMDTYAMFVLPAYYCTHAYGFTERELDEFAEFLKDNAPTLWRMARGEINAKGIG